MTLIASYCLFYVLVSGFLLFTSSLVFAVEWLHGEHNTEEFKGNLFWAFVIPALPIVIPITLLRSALRWWLLD